MSLRPIPGAPAGAMIPDFPGASKPEPIVAPDPEPKPTVQKPRPVVVEGSGTTAMHLFWLPQVASLMIMVSEEAPSRSPVFGAQRQLAELNIHEDDGVAFLRSVRDRKPAEVSDRGFRLEYEVTERGHLFSLFSRHHTKALRLFRLSWSQDTDWITRPLLAERGIA